MPNYELTQDCKSKATTTQTRFLCIAGRSVRQVPPKCRQDVTCSSERVGAFRGVVALGPIQPFLRRARQGTVKLLRGGKTGVTQVSHRSWRAESVGIDVTRCAESIGEGITNAPVSRSVTHLSRCHAAPRRPLAREFAEKGLLRGRAQQRRRRRLPTSLRLHDAPPASYL